MIILAEDAIAANCHEMQLIVKTKKRSGALISHTEETIKKMISEGEIINYTTVSNRAQVSRNFLYSHQELRDVIDACRVTGLTKRELQKELSAMRYKYREK